MQRKYSLLVIMIVALLATTIVSLNTFTVQASNAQISTDKADYAPNDTVVISGSGFLASHNVVLTLTGPAGFTTKTWNTQTDTNGNLQTTYNQGLIRGNLQSSSNRWNKHCGNNIHRRFGICPDWYFDRCQF